MAIIGRKENMRKTLENTVYRHYKGNLYYVIGTAKHTETNEMMVIYHALYGKKDMFVRPESMFLSEMEQSDENLTKQKYRFQEIELTSEIELRDGVTKHNIDDTDLLKEDVYYKPEPSDRIDI